jgi:chloramphenicol 3-O phosphotransferase
MDYPLSEQRRLADLLEVLDGFDVTLVDVMCSPAELARRERDRGDRPVGLATNQRVYEHGDCDLSIDTTACTPDECAEHAVSHLDMLRRPKAFDRLRLAQA